jgi:hypothetical protein
MDDTSRIESVIQTFYEVISGPAGHERDWDKMRALFVPGASLVSSSVALGASPPEAIDVGAYVRRLAAWANQQGFFETGHIHRIEMFGNIATVVSMYEARHHPDESEPFRRGVCFMQMLGDGEQWRLTSMIWRDDGKAA